MTVQTHEQIVAESMAQKVATVMGKKVTRGELAAAFDLVKNREHWKNHIDCVVDLDDRQMAMITEAVIFFTGSVPEFAARKGATLPKCRYRVRADGYFATIGA